MSKDLTRTPLLHARSNMTEVQRWVNTVAVRGNFDWMPGIAGYAEASVATVTLTNVYQDLLSFSFTPRVKCRVIVAFSPSISVTVDSPIVTFDTYTTPAPLSSSLTDQTSALGSGIVSLGAGVVSGRMTTTVLNSFDLAAGVTYIITGRALNSGTGTAIFRNPSVLTGIHFPLLTPAGQ